MLNNILTRVNDFMYTYPLLILLVGAGVYFTVRTRFVQGRLLGEAFRVLLEKAEVKDGKKQVSSFLGIDDIHCLQSGNRQHCRNCHSHCCRRPALCSGCG